MALGLRRFKIVKATCRQSGIQRNEKKFDKGKGMQLEVLKSKLYELQWFV